ncbi:MULTISPECIES: TadE/TadG family type IV pilus assembly protein [unclassified Myxococcus]|uniref:TadE/TadG family type IV pilus assembly protein n=1 Tax=unclassified Myxococcus TaxID=2648731 RepID=UPI00157B7201|nr:MULTISPECIES: TadE/TadG family type IV pilus assembly protein [unclassified Myxococcus]NTX06393.1 pilus assembly protein [Myxococcus sp. CA040A]NTX09648.1 pilus assembly protein [Myxococcus sp. CA056]NTX35012.1 pilus assembly protein [Myxococcus sp. CA033]NTX51479.1 pilus assembly protein [Myxococcus sp. CA039A]
MTTPIATKRRSWQPGRRARRGAATTEFALLAPVMVVLILGTSYFWEVQHVRLKAAELARYVAFERTVRPDLGRITAEAQERYQDLDGSTKTGELPTGLGHQNRLTLNVRVENANAALQEESLSERGSKGGATQFMGKVLGVLGSTAGYVAKAMGLDPDEGAVRAQVEVHIENGIIPPQIAFLTSRIDDDRLDLNFKETFFLVHDTWRAWGHGDDPANSYPRVQQLTHDRVKQIAYAGLASEGGALDTIGAVLSVLGLDFPLKSDYIRDSVLIRHVKEGGRYNAVRKPRGGDTRTVPGDKLLAAYWKNDTRACFDSCEPDEIKEKRGRARTEYGHFNWPMRAYNCRGKYFQGTVDSKEPESEYARSKRKGEDYFTYGDLACSEKKEE